MIKILEENEFFLILNKPAGTSVHNESPSLVEFLTKHKKPIHFVNRIDRETSGLVLVAKKPEIHDQLNDALDNGEKVYRAVLRGPWKKSDKKATWSWALTDKAEGRQNPKGLAAGRIACESQATLVRTNTYFSEVTVKILTGRQHQIRKHAAIAKLPIVGDNRYNEKKYNNMVKERYGSDRMWLHAEKLQFEYNNKKYNFENKLNTDSLFKAIESKKVD
ncbi:MAG: RNA pseudouridine synthase [Pseudobdellovibrio sp.]